MNRLILNKAEPNLTLSVRMNFDAQGHAPVVLMPMIQDQFGRANQKWAYEEGKCLFHCFQTNDMDKGLRFIISFLIIESIEFIRL